MSQVYDKYYGDFTVFPYYRTYLHSVKSFKDLVCKLKLSNHVLRVDVAGLDSIKKQDISGFTRYSMEFVPAFYVPKMDLFIYTRNQVYIEQVNNIKFIVFRMACSNPSVPDFSVVKREDTNVDWVY